MVRLHYISRELYTPQTHIYIHAVQHHQSLQSPLIRPKNLASQVRGMIHGARFYTPSTSPPKTLGMPNRLSKASEMAFTLATSISTSIQFLHSYHNKQWYAPPRRPTSPT